MATTEEKPEKAAKPDEAELLGVKKSKVKMTAFKSNPKVKPADIEKEEKRHEKLIAKRTENRIAKAKAEAKMKPIDKRRALLESRFKAVKNRTRANTYSDANLKAWIEEYNLIVKNPKAWNKATANGTKNYTPGNKKKKTAKDILDGMNLDEE